MKEYNLNAVELMRALRDKQNEKINKNPAKFYSELAKYDSKFTNITNNSVVRQEINNS